MDLVFEALGFLAQVAAISLLAVVVFIFVFNIKNGNYP